MIISLINIYQLSEKDIIVLIIYRSQEFVKTVIKKLLSKLTCFLSQGDKK